MPNSARLLFALVALLFTGATRADLGDFLADVVAAHGGGATPSAIHERGSTESLRRGNGPVERWWLAPDRFRIEIRYPGAPESRLMRGADAWQQGQPATPAFHGAVVLQAARMALPWRLRDNVEQVRDLGALPLGNGKQVRSLEWRVRDGIRMIIEIDPETRLIMRSRGILTINNSSMEFATGYENYQTVSGRRVAMTERHFAMGQYIGSTTLEDVEFPAVLPAPTFDPPSSEQRAAASGRDATGAGS
ncbi:MAG: hypothetical protein HZA62_08950 [Rhodocyclales bacterium]|nr:hypothetical protein [Rhodocyclales bacterium]